MELVILPLVLAVLFHLTARIRLHLPLHFILLLILILIIILCTTSRVVS